MARSRGPARYRSPGFSRMATEVMTRTSVQMTGAVSGFSLKALAQMMEDSAARLSKQQQAFVDAIAADAIPPAMIKQMNYDVGKAAQQSVQQAFTHRRGRVGTPPYRTAPKDPRNQRFAGGLLLRALQAEDFFEATEHGLLWGNVARLDLEAKQWKRINFGAGRGANTPPQVFPMQWSDFVSEAIGIAPDPQPAFKIPAGYWISGGNRAHGEAGAEFYPTKEAPPGRWGRPSRARMTGGIAATNFMDAGVRRIAEELPKAVSTMMGRVYRNRPLATQIKSTTGITIPMPSGSPRFGRLR